MLSFLNMVAKKSKKNSSQNKKINQSIDSIYNGFDQINGQHNLQNRVIESCVLYSARSRAKAKVVYFNFALGKEMGLILEDHAEELNDKLVQKLIDTFAIIIINEYDIEHKTHFDPASIKKFKYMATRYLQLQHPNKQGKTSGDGRSLWNGQFKFNNKQWDISSCGTGATCLSPAAAIQQKNFKSGDPSVSYGCGLSEIDEGIATLLMSEIFHRNSIKTERVLCVLRFPGNFSITVRAHNNLLRPSHLFSHLKQNNLVPLKNIVDFYIEKQFFNKEWSGNKKNIDNLYHFFLEKIIYTFAEMAAKFESEYIFCWMDWDGDNILMDGSIIDYGSVRQFGLYHNNYRFDDVERYSTTISEQKNKVKYMVKIFIQMVDFINKGKKSPLCKFSKSSYLKDFDRIFENKLQQNLLLKIGIKIEDAHFLIEKHLALVKKFQVAFKYFERVKSHEGLIDVPDGISWNAIFCMRDLLRELPLLYLSSEENITHQEFIDILKSDYATDEDLLLSTYRKKMINSFLKCYKKLINALVVFKKKEFDSILLEVSMRSSIINRYERITGDSITNVVARIMEKKLQEKPTEFYEMMLNFINYQVLDPDYQKKEYNIKDKKFMNVILQEVHKFREGL